MINYLKIFLMNKLDNARVYMFNYNEIDFISRMCIIYMVN